MMLVRAAGGCVDCGAFPQGIRDVTEAAATRAEAGVPGSMKRTPPR